MCVFFVWQKMVIKTKSVKYMPLTLSIANLCNGIVWLIYSLLKFDINILVINYSSKIKLKFYIMSFGALNIL